VKVLFADQNYPITRGLGIKKNDFISALPTLIEINRVDPFLSISPPEILLLLKNGLLEGQFQPTNSRGPSGEK